MAQQKSWTLVVGLDLGECGERALKQALELAAGRDAVVHIAHAVTRSELGAGSKIEQQDEALERLPREIWKKVFKALEDLNLGYEDVPVWLHVRLGSPEDVVRQVAVDYDADLVVVGTHGRSGLKRMVLGSVAEKLIRDGHFPVLVAHENRLGELEKTTLPDEPLPEGHEVSQGTAERPHIYRSTLISAWGAFGRPTSPSSLF